MNRQGSQSVLSEELLQKHGLKLTLQQVADAQDGQVVNGCLVLKKEEYQAGKFQKRADFVAVLATRLKKVPANMFYKATNLRTLVLPEAEEIADSIDDENGGDNQEIDVNNKDREEIDESSSDIGSDISSDIKDGSEINESSHEDEEYEYNSNIVRGGAFALTAVDNCCFQKLKRVGAFAFCKCPITFLDSENFPILEAIGNSAFADSRATSVDLLNLRSVGEFGFYGCKSLTSFSAKRLDAAGKSCFSNCPLLSSINCDLAPKKFVCRCYGCDACPTCYHDVERCLKRGRFGNDALANPEQEEIDQQALDKALKKLNVGITVQQALDADEGSIINGCLILKEERYLPDAFINRMDFTSVFARGLRHVAKEMFYGALNFKTAVMPEAVGAMKESLCRTGLQHCFFPKLARIADFAFARCKLAELNSDSFPRLESVGYCGFSASFIAAVNLPSLVSVGQEGFVGCQNLGQFSAGKLAKIGKSCFSNCPLLSSISCKLEPEQVVCDPKEGSECDGCPDCYSDVELCLERGPQEDVEVDQQTINKVLKKFKVGVTVQQAMDAEEGQVINECLVLKEEHYRRGAFEDKPYGNIKAVLALRLRHVGSQMFNLASKLKTAIMPKVGAIMDGGFQNTRLRHMFFPKVIRIGRDVFQNCEIEALNSESFPALESVGKRGFAYCSLRSVCLPRLISVGKQGFVGCPNLEQFSAEKLKKVGVGCFSRCQKLQSISCELGPEHFKCDQCYEGCPACTGKLPECLNKGAAPRKLEQVQSDQNSLLVGWLEQAHRWLSLLEQTQRDEWELQRLQQKLENVCQLGDE